MDRFKRFMLKNRFVAQVLLFPFVFFFVVSLFSFLLHFILPVLVSLYLTKVVYAYLTKKSLPFF